MPSRLSLTLSAPPMLTACPLPATRLSALRCGPACLRRQLGPHPTIGMTTKSAVAGDNVVIPTGASVTYDYTTYPLSSGSLTVEGSSSLAVPEGSLTVSAPSSIATLDLDGGNLIYNADVTVSDGFTWTTGTLTGAGQFTVVNSSDTVSPSINTANATAFTVGQASAFTVSIVGTPLPTLSESGTPAERRQLQRGNRCPERHPGDVHCGHIHLGPDSDERGRLARHAELRTNGELGAGGVRPHLHQRRFHGLHGRPGWCFPGERRRVPGSHVFAESGSLPTGVSFIMPPRGC